MKRRSENAALNIHIHNYKWKSILAWSMVSWVGWISVGMCALKGHLYRLFQVAFKHWRVTFTLKMHNTNRDMVRGNPFFLLR